MFRETLLVTDEPHPCRSSCRDGIDLYRLICLLSGHTTGKRTLLVSKFIPLGLQLFQGFTMGLWYDTVRELTVTLPTLRPTFIAAPSHVVPLYTQSFCGTFQFPIDWKE
jgi:hypothetical protein